jgi:hypothetical protein
MELPGFKITYDDGSSYNTSMAANVTLEMARTYFLGSIHTKENFETGEEIKRTVSDVQKI